MFQKYLKQSTKIIGDYYENLACDYLKRNHYKILERNYRTRLGEIDIICKKKNELIFVEVKGGKSFPEPYLRVDAKKIQKLILTMEKYIHSSVREWDYIRLDVISITEPLKEMKHFQDILS